MKNFIFFSLIVVLAALKIHAQNDKKWQVTLGVNAVDVRKPSTFLGMSGDYFKISEEDINFYGTPLRLSVARKLSESFMAQASVSTNKLKKGIDWVKGDPYVNYSFLYVDAKVLYDLNKLVGEMGWFDPYLGLGIGYSKMNLNDFKVNGTWGVNMWLNSNWGINIESSYNHNFKETFKYNYYSGTGTDFFQHALGITYKFGNTKTKDSDKDGVPDADDKCPNVPGSIALQGCPDEPDDSKVEIRETVLMDSDNDGIPDDKDQCPYVAGLSTHNGCPEPKKTESSSSVTTPQEFNAADAKRNLNNIIIYFDFDSDIIRPSEIEKLKQASSLINSLVQTNILLKGHTDEFGSELYNLNLSKSRTESVLTYLKSLGVDTSKISIEGLGKKVPASKNQNLNRRVEFVVE